LPRPALTKQFQQRERCRPPVYLLSVFLHLRPVHREKGKPVPCQALGRVSSLSIGGRNTSRPRQPGENHDSYGAGRSRFQPVIPAGRVRRPVPADIIIGLSWLTAVSARTSARSPPAPPEHADMRALSRGAPRESPPLRSPGFLRRFSGGLSGNVDPALVLVAGDLCGNEAGRDTGPGPGSSGATAV
jgi:hypothetical protein